PPPAPGPWSEAGEPRPRSGEVPAWSWVLEEGERNIAIPTPGTVSPHWLTRAAARLPDDPAPPSIARGWRQKTGARSPPRRTPRLARGSRGRPPGRPGRSSPRPLP